MSALSLRGVTALWRQPGAVRDRPGDRGRRIRLAAGPQRHGQVHHGQGHHGPEPRQPGEIRFDGRDIGALPAYQVAQCGIGLVPEGRHIFPNLSVRENLVATAHNRQRLAQPWTLERVYALFPGWPNAPATWAATCPAASNRCWPSAARC